MIRTKTSMGAQTKRQRIDLAINDFIENPCMKTRNFDEAENGDARNYRNLYRRGDIRAKFLGKMCLPEVQETLLKARAAH